MKVKVVRIPPSHYKYDWRGRAEFVPKSAIEPGPLYSLLTCLIFRQVMDIYILYSVRLTPKIADAILVRLNYWLIIMLSVT